MTDKTAKNENGLTFAAWMSRVDAAIGKVCGLGHSDLADWHYWDAWNDGVSPAEAAEEVLGEEGFPFED